MNHSRVLTAVIGMCIGCALTLAAAVLYFPGQWKRHRSVVCPALYTNYRNPLKPCPSLPTGLTLTLADRPRPRVEPLTEIELGSRSDHRTVFAKFSNSWAESRAVFFVIRGPFIDVDARFDTDYGNFVGAVQTVGSDAHMHDGDLCFDLTVERLDGSSALERWQRRFDLK